MSVIEKVCLMNPGPVTLSRRVRQALQRPDLCHREPDFAALQNDVRDRLVRVYPAAERDFVAVLLTGSGTAAVEAMVGSLVPHAGKAVVVENGIYGERISAMLRVQGKHFAVVRSDWTEPMDVAAVARTLEDDPAVTHVIAVHHETTTGRLNDIRALGSICKQRGVPLLLDTVSSFGGEEIDFAAWNVEACASTANKCLHGVPGICFVIVRKDILTKRASAAVSLYLDLFRNYEEQCKGYPLFTPAVQSLYGLQEALGELQESGGWEARQSHYSKLSRLIRTGLRERGAPLLLQGDHCYSATLTSFYLPVGVEFRPLYERLRRTGFVIYPGVHWLAATVFRVAVMGDLTRRDAIRFLDAFSEATTAAVSYSPRR
jgi:2-aminoethylphosphonate-pyruvate transaminase